MPAKTMKIDIANSTTVSFRDASGSISFLNSGPSLRAAALGGSGVKTGSSSEESLLAIVSSVAVESQSRHRRFVLVSSASRKQKSLIPVAAAFSRRPQCICLTPSRRRRPLLRRESRSAGAGADHPSGGARWAINNQQATSLSHGQFTEHSVSVNPLNRSNELLEIAASLAWPTRCHRAT